MERVKVQSSTARSTKIYVPVDGLISIDDQGIAEVSPKCALALTKNSTNWSLVGAKTAASANGEEELPEDVEDAETPEDVKKRLEGMTAAALKELAAEAGCTEDEIKAAKNKALLVALLMDKYATASEEEETVEEELPEDVEDQDGDGEENLDEELPEEDE